MSDGGGRVTIAAVHPNERHQTIAFLLSVGALPLGCPAAEDDETATSPFTTSVSTTSASNTTADSNGTDDGTGGTDSDASASGTSASTTASSTTNATTASTTASTTESTTDSTTMSTTDPTVSTDPDTGYGTYGSSGGYSCGRVEIPQACMQYAAKVVECYPRYAGGEAMIAESCACGVDYYNMNYGVECASAFEDFYACLASTSCEVLMGGGACEAEGMAINTACGFGGTGGGE